MRKGINSVESNVLIVQMSNDWSKNHLEQTRDEITELILRELDFENSDWIKNAEHHAHRWRFARPYVEPSRLEHDRITCAGDAWAEPLGTVQAAIKSAEDGAFEMIWKRHYAKKQAPISLQTTLF